MKEQEEPIVTFRTYFDPMLAQIERGKLMDNGIQCFIADENVAVINPFYNNAIGGIKLKVFQRDVEQCEVILAQHDEMPLEDMPLDETNDAGEAVHCPYCNSDNVRYGDATEKKYAWWAIIIAFLSAALPFYSRKAWHCFNCGKDFKEPGA